MNFLMLEGGYLAIATFILIVTAIVTTRPFMPKNAFKKGFGLVFAFLAIAIGLHYYITTNRMDVVQSAFDNGEVIICESKALRKAARTILIEKEKNWQLQNDIFVSPEYERGFHSARCLVHIY
ncbi:MAG: hypothetical protein K0U47_05555 [Epsilonproteobacteria bacterium]|nr:hypothetical protein [Campylobacterota bacterium]